MGSACPAAWLMVTLGGAQSEGYCGGLPLMVWMRHRDFGNISQQQRDPPIWRIALLCHICWSRWSGSNRRPAVYETAYDGLPLRSLSHSDALYVRFDTSTFATKNRRLPTTTDRLTYRLLFLFLLGQSINQIHESLTALSSEYL